MASEECDDMEDIDYTRQVYMGVVYWILDLENDKRSIIFTICPNSRMIEIWDTGIEIRTQLKAESIQFTEDELASKESVSDMLLSTEAVPLVLNREEVDEFVDKLAEYASRLLRVEAENDNKKCIGSKKSRKLVFHMSCLAVRRYCHNETDVDPAMWPCIESLEKVIVDEKQEDEDKCCICLATIKLGSRVTRMPCNHMFHDNCIVQWLTLKRRCPLCCFEMPEAPSSSSYRYLD